MFVVYWMEGHGPSGFSTHSEMFEPEEMSKALKFMEELRKEKMHFVTMCSENPNSVGKPGVDEVGSDYNWTKRRGNMPKTKL